MKETLDKFGDTIGNIEVKRIIKDDCQSFISKKYKTTKISAHQQFDFNNLPLKTKTLVIINYKGFIVSAGGLEPPTLCLKGRCSTTELRARTIKI